MLIGDGGANALLGGADVLVSTPGLGGAGGVIVQNFTLAQLQDQIVIA